MAARCPESPDETGADVSEPVHCIEGSHELLDHWIVPGCSQPPYIHLGQQPGHAETLAVLLGKGGQQFDRAVARRATPPSQLAERISATNGSSRSSTALRTHRKPVPRGPRRNFRPVPVIRSARKAAASTGNCLIDWVASSRNSGPRVTGNPSDLRGRVDESAARRDVTDAKQLGPLVHEIGQRRGVELPAAVVRHHDQLGPAPLRHLEVGQNVAAVLRATGQNCRKGRSRRSGQYRNQLVEVEAVAALP